MFQTPVRRNRWRQWFLGVGLASGMTMLVGCDQGLFSFQRESFFGKSQKIEDECPINTVSSMTVVAGAQSVEVLGVGLVTGLNGTGGDPPPGMPRSMMLRELRARGEKEPQKVLASGDVAVVQVKGRLTPGAMKSDLIDLEVECFDEDKQTSNLRGGELQTCKLLSYTDANALANQILDDGKSRSGEKLLGGRPLVQAKGRIISSSSAEKSGNVQRSGRIASGGAVLEEMAFLMILKPEFQTSADNALGKWFGETRTTGAATNKMISEQIDIRFRAENAGYGKIATAKDNQVISLRIPGRYRLNPDHYLSVVSEIPLMLRPESRHEWKKMLARDLLIPEKAQKAAARLEAMGGDVDSILETGLQSNSPWVRFCAAESLTYLGKSSGVDTLVQSMQHEPGCRPYALTALGSSEQPACQAKLQELLGSDSTETRCGAFMILQKRTRLPQKDVVTLENIQQVGFSMNSVRLADGTSLYILGGDSKPLVHVSTNGRPAIAVFGKNPTLVSPVSLTVGNDYVIHAKPGEEMCNVSLVTTNGSQRESCDLRVSSICQMLSKLGADYQDLMDFLRKAERSELLNCPLAVDAVPQVQPLNPNTFGKGTATSPVTQATQR